MGKTTTKGRHRVYGSAIHTSDGRPARASAGRHTSARSAAGLIAPKPASTSKFTTGAPAKTSGPKPTKEEVRALLDALSVLAFDEIAAESTAEERAAFETKKAAALDTLAAYLQGQLPESYQEKASAVREQLQALTARVAHAEKASARATIARVQAQAAAMRHEARYGSCSMIERAGRNTMRALTPPR